MKSPALFERLRGLRLAMAMLGALRCSSPALDEPAGDRNPSSDTAELRVGRSTQINKVSYTLTGPNGFSTSGSVDVSKYPELVNIVIPNVPVGGPYSLSTTAKSTDGNVTCTGNKTSMSESCPNKTVVLKLTCTRNHLGREWGDRDWRSNARTFFLGAMFKLKCRVPEGGTDACTPMTCASQGIFCGPTTDGCGHALSCGTCPTGEACSLDGKSCICQRKASCGGGQTCGEQSDNCGGTLDCGACANGTVCNGTMCVCPPVTCAAGQCGTVTNACGSTASCGGCPSGGTCGSDNQCNCPPPVCPAAQECGTVSGCGSTVSCGICPAGKICDTVGHCVASPNCPTQCPAGACGTITNSCGVTLACPACTNGATCGVDNVCLCPPAQCASGQQCGMATNACGASVNCGTCPASQVCDSTGHCVTNPSCPTTCPAGMCGDFADVCGGTLHCGPCANGLACDANNLCMCPPAVCAVGQNCGTANNACGSHTSCGTCAPGTEICQDGTPPHCVANTACLTACPLGACGTISDNCGGTLNCGCPTGYVCDSTNRCVCPPPVCLPGETCGSHTNACGNVVNCGTCPGGSGTVCGLNHACICPTPACAPGQTCGTATNQCGSTTVCGPCPAGWACEGTSCKKCATCASLGMVCGSAPDGCGNMLNCGTCPTGGTCSADGTRCICPPPVCAPGQNCGTVSNACGETLSCGTCTAPFTCGGAGVAGTCGYLEHPCGPQTGSTEVCLISRETAAGSCYPCAVDMGCFDPQFLGRTCEQLSGVPANGSCASSVGQISGPGPTESDVCFATLEQIFSTHCAAGLQLNPCLCGTTAPDTCLDGSAAPTGPLYPLYGCDLSTTSPPSINQIINNVVSPAYGAGVANAIVQCVQAFDCGCAY